MGEEGGGGGVDEDEGVGVVLHDSAGPLGADLPLDELADGLGLARPGRDEHELPPYWILVNLMDFGTMLRLFSGAPTEIRNKLANGLGLSSRVLESWLVTINTVRNICAHHGRLWNRGIGTRPIIPKRSKHSEWHEPFSVRSDNMFGILTILSYLLEHIAPKTFWRERLFKLLGRLSFGELSRIGFTKS